MRSRIFLLLISTVILFSETLFAEPVDSLPISGKIAYLCARFPLEEGVIDSDMGTCIYENGKVKLAYHRLWNPRWSKDGRKLIGGFFQSEKNGFGIFEYPNRNYLRHKTGLAMGNYSFLPDSAKILFKGTNANSEVTPQNIYLYDLETEQLKQLTHFKEKREASLHSIDLSPDGHTIVFSRYSWNQNKTFITLISIDGTGIETLPFEGDDVRFSPDGKKLAFVSPYYEGKENKQWEIVLYDLETKEIQRVSNIPAMKSDLTFSPDGKQIAFVLWGNGPYKNIGVINIDGTGFRTLFSSEEDTHAYIGSLDWAP